MTWRSCPAPIFVPPPCELGWVAADAPDSAVKVPANADVDQLGKLAASGDATEGTGLLE
jgi:hypothetical protein